MAWSDVPLWEEAETECKHGNFQAAAASLLKCISRRTMPAAAAGAVLAVSRHSDVGFNEYDLGGHKLARAIEKGEHLDTSQTKRCKKLAERYATQAMTTVWGAGGSAGAKRLRRLFEGRDPRSGEALRWGDDGGGSDEAVEVGGAADSSDEDEAEAEDEDSDSGSFIVPDESEAADEAESSERGGGGGGGGGGGPGAPQARSSRWHARQEASAHGGAQAAIRGRGGGGLRGRGPR